MVGLLLAICGFSVQGVVREASSGDPIAYARIESIDGTAQEETDSAGRYRLACLDVSTHAIRISRLGFATRTIEIGAAAGDTLQLDVELSERPFVLPPVAVAGRPPAGSEAADALGLPTARLSAREMAESPLVGDPDPLLSLPVPDALTSGDPLPGLHVRGGSAGQTLTLLDGVPVYHPYHAGGVSALSADAISRVSLYSDAPPARWDGGLASVLAADTRPAADEARGWKGSADPLWVEQFYSRPILDGRGDLLLGGRVRNALLSIPDHGRGASGADELARLAVPMLGGETELLVFGSQDRVRFDTTVSAATLGQRPSGGDGATDNGSGIAPGNGFKWATQTEAFKWAGPAGWPLRLDIRAWRTAYDATVTWLAPVAVEALSSLRNIGAAAAVSGRVFSTLGEIGVDAQRFGARYAVRPTGPVPAPGAFLGQTAGPIVLGAFLEDRWHPAGGQWDVAGGLRGDVTPWGAVGLEPRLSVRFAPVPSVALTTTYGESRQYLQSATNEESIIGTVAGMALPLAADGHGVPVGVADQVTASLVLRPASGTAVTLEGYQRRMDGLLEVAPVTALPFATTSLAVGSGRSSGALLSFERRTPRVTIEGVYALGTTALSASGVSYTPAADPTHAFGAGVSVRGSDRTSLRAAIWGSFGRRASVIRDSLTWGPASQLGGIGDLDGSPVDIQGPLDGAALPAYLRLDLGLRHAWMSAFGRAARVTGSITVTNVLSRTNVAGMLQQPASGLPIQTLPLTGRTLSVRFEWNHQ